MQARSLTPLERIADDCRDQVLSEWVEESLQALEDAATLVAHDRCLHWARRARRDVPWLGLLVPAYTALARRYAMERHDGRQHDLFAGDTDTIVLRRWAVFARGFVRGRGRACRQRWILLAAIGPIEADELAALSRVQAANLLAGEVMTASLAAFEDRY